jgi:V8-like Glu-specific endopeptidase
MTLSAPSKRGPWFAIGALACLVLPAVPAAAIVGGAPFADRAIARHVVLIVGGHSLCTGVAIAPDLVLTAAHCVLSNGKYRLLAFDGRRPVMKDVASVTPHPQFSLRADAPDWLSSSLRRRWRRISRLPRSATAGAAFGRRPVHCRGLRCRGAR